MVLNYRWGELLGKYLKRSGMTQDALAQTIVPRTGKPMYSANVMINGFINQPTKKPPSLENVMIIADVLSLSTEEKLEFFLKARNERVSKSTLEFDDVIREYKKRVLIEKDKSIDPSLVDCLAKIHKLSSDDLKVLNSILEKFVSRERSV